MFYQKLFVIIGILIVSAGCKKNETVTPFDPKDEIQKSSQDINEIKKILEEKEKLLTEKNDEATKQLELSLMALSAQSRFINLSLLKQTSPKTKDKYIFAYNYFMNMDFQVVAPDSEKLHKKAINHFMNDTKSFLFKGIDRDVQITEKFLNKNFKMDDGLNSYVLSTAISAINPQQEEKGTNVSFYDVIKKDIVDSRSSFYTYLLQIRHNALVDLVLVATGGNEVDVGKLWEMDYIHLETKDVMQLTNALHMAIETQSFLSQINVNPIKLNGGHLKLKGMDIYIDEDDELEEDKITALKGFEQAVLLVKAL